MKVGILTFHDGINYGAFMQVYSLQSSLESLGCEVEIINYKKFSFWLKEYIHFIKKDLSFFNNFKKIRSFHKLQKKFLNCGEFSFNVKKISNGYDIVFFGSDEIWNVNNPGFGFDPVYMGHGITSQLVSYAPSFGSTTIDTLKPSVHYLLGCFSKISVRDENSLKIVEKLGIKNSFLVPDPTLLIDLDFPVVKPKDNNYLLVYSGEDIPKARQRQLIKFSSENKLKIISVGFNHDFADKSYSGASVPEWLGFIECASFVYTNMFHGTLFSLIFEKCFAVDLSEYRKNKFSHTINRLCVGCHILSPEENLTFNKFTKDHNFYDFREEGLKYLKEVALCNE